ncbi:MAG: ABC transporter ATP-binding protein [Candidatus Dormibacteraeota bacterium]|nr:ABC transporter ATP-binding protein [Candidatus Dormibacteraeota bacterium]
MISVAGLEKRYGGHLALRGVDFEVPEGEIFGFLGPNGAGKTSTIRILATLIPPDGGTATVAGVPVDRDPYEVQKLIGYTPDFFGVYDRLTSVEYLEFYGACHDLPAARRRKAAHELLELVNLTERAADQVDTLSRGMKQRLCLARALVHNPKVLLLDEPASGLDPGARIEMRELIRELRRMGKTILISSHVIPEVEELCTWVGVIDNGRMVEVGPKADVLRRVVAGSRVQVVLFEADQDSLRKARERVEGRPGVISIETTEAGLELAVEDGFANHELLRDLIRAGVAVSSYTPVTGNLSDVFMRLTG